MKANPDDFSRRLKVSPNSPVLRMHGLLRMSVSASFTTDTPTLSSDGHDNRTRYYIQHDIELLAPSHAFLDPPGIAQRGRPTSSALHCHHLSSASLTLVGYNNNASHLVLSD